MSTDQIFEFFKKSVKKNRVCHSAIIYGGTEDERKKVAVNIANILECETSPEICGKCYACRTIPAGNFPDVHIVQVEKQTLSIDEVRKIKEQMYIKPYVGRRRIFIIETSWMQQPAANSLLKIMEEPPSYGMIIILTYNNKNFLPTIISRAINLKLNPDIKMPVDDRRVIDEIMQLIEPGYKKDWSQLFKTAEKISRNSTREEIEYLFDSFVRLARQSLLANHGITYLLPEDSSRDIINIDNHNVLSEILDKRQYLRFNVNIRIFLQILSILVSQPKWRNWQTR